MLSRHTPKYPTETQVHTSRRHTTQPDFDQGKGVGRSTEAQLALAHRFTCALMQIHRRDPMTETWGFLRQWARRGPSNPPGGDDLCLLQPPQHSGCKSSPNSNIYPTLGPLVCLKWKGKENNSVAFGEGVGHVRGQKITSLGQRGEGLAQGQACWLTQEQR